MTIWTPAFSTQERPLYRALAEALEQDIQTGVLQPGDRLPTHRDLADSLGMNVSTVTRAYAEVERKGLVSGTVGRGTFVASDAAASKSMTTLDQEAAMLELGLATPLYGQDPDLAQALENLSKDRDKARELMRYARPEGLPEHRMAGAEWLKRYNLEVTPDDVAVTSGSQHGLFCALAAAFSQGRRVAVEALTYPGLKQPAATLGLTLTPVAMDSQGMLPDALDAAARRDDLAGLYLTPSVHNPTTARMGEDRRDELARIIRKHSMILVEDDPYALCLNDPPAPVSARLPDHSVFVGGTSKFVGAGLRTGFAAARGVLRRKLTDMILATTWMAPTLSAELTSRWIMDGTADRRRKDKLREAAGRFHLAGDIFKGHRLNGFEGSFFVWLTLPEPWTGRNLEEAAAMAGVRIFGAERFVVGGAPTPRGARISLSGPASLNELATGLLRILDALEGLPPVSGPML